MAGGEERSGQREEEGDADAASDQEDDVAALEAGDVGVAVGAFDVQCQRRVAGACGEGGGVAAVDAEEEAEVIGWEQEQTSFSEELVVLVVDILIVIMILLVHEQELLEIPLLLVLHRVVLVELLLQIL